MLGLEDIHRHLTNALVDEVPIDVVFERSALVPDGAGGFTDGASASLQPQTVRLVSATAASNVVGGTPRTTPEGAQYTPAYFLIGDVDLDVEIGDEFIIEGDRYSVTDINKPKHWRTRAEAVRLAG